MMGNAAPRAASPPRRGSPVAPRAPPPSPQSAILSPWSIKNEALEDYAVPDLRQRKAIWTHFPVDVIKIPGHDEKYVIRWNRTKFEEMRNAANISWNAAMEFEAFQEYRLLHALRAHSDIYRLEPPRGSDEIIIIAMEKPAPAAHIPVLCRLTDIKDRFPGIVVWKKVEGRKGESTYALEVMRAFERANPPAVVDRALHDLMTALHASRCWYVLPAEYKGELARLEMRHDR
jgi:hypothetical protein